ncbi:GNAT family N-acetyltransferase [Sphingobacterium prati]|uniref:GNAT family N-acetyltransferase n=1 Tax=Sphingobacterium prati TaxID=2737006 RepID=UPI0015548D50|nr:GNAT family N-acetyltransferase [Sphingobacterium prati]NPE45619.1 GNAT family N-acetyltransferase [Sphingobacterium prati]
MHNTLEFKKYMPEDFTLFKELVKDDVIMKYISGKGLTPEQAKKKFTSILDINADPLLGYFKVIDSASQLFLGDCKLVNYRKDPTVFEIGYLLKKEFWRKGLGTKICESLLAMAQDIDANKNVVGIIDPANIASKQLLTKFGFQSFFIGVEDDISTEKLILKRT